MARTVEIEYRPKPLQVGDDIPQDEWFRLGTYFADGPIEVEIPGGKDPDTPYQARWRLITDEGDIGEWAYSDEVAYTPGDPEGREPPAPPSPARLECQGGNLLVWDPPPGEIEGYEVRHTLRDGTPPVWETAIPAHPGMVTVPILSLCRIPTGLRSVGVRAIDPFGVPGEPTWTVVDRGPIESDLPSVQRTTPVVLNDPSITIVGGAFSAGVVSATPRTTMWDRRPVECRLWSGDPTRGWWGNRWDSLDVDMPYQSGPVSIPYDPLKARLVVGGTMEGIDQRREIGWAPESMWHDPVAPMWTDPDAPMWGRYPNATAPMWGDPDAPMWGAPTDAFWSETPRVPWPGFLDALPPSALRIRFTVPGGPQRGRLHNVEIRESREFLGNEPGGPLTLGPDGLIPPGLVPVGDHNSLSGRSAPSCHPASSIDFTPHGSIAATTVQLALEELADEAISDHGALSGLADDDHTQYVHNTTARTVTARHTFNPPSPNSPFILGANAQGQLVTGLNADLLDGLSSAAFDAAGAAAAAYASAAADLAAHAAASDPHTGYQKETEKDAANGYAGLDANARLLSTRLQVSATARVICRKTTGAGASEEATVSEVLDLLP